MYQWDFGDNSTIISGTNLNEVEHVFAADGAYTITLTVTDIDEAANNQQIDIEVNNLAPKAIINTEYVVKEGEELILDASQSTDPGQDELLFTWDLDGDGQANAEGSQLVFDAAEIGLYDILPVSYTHLTLPTNREV